MLLKIFFPSTARNRPERAKLTAAADEFDLYARSVRRRLLWEAYRLCGDWHEAEDLVQVTLYDVYRRWLLLTERNRLVSYTRRALRNAYVSEHRRPRWRREVSCANPPDLVASDGQQAEPPVDLIDAVHRLGPRQQAVIRLRFWQDLSVEQTANALGCSTGTVTSQTHRALARLREILMTAGSGRAPQRNTRCPPSRSR